MDKQKVHEEFVHQFKFYLFNVGHDFNKASFRAIDETFQVMWENNYYEKMAQMEEAHNQPPPDKCLIIDSDEEDNSPKKNDRLRTARTLKALKEIIDELNKSVEALQEENKKLKKENKEWQEQCVNLCKKGLEFAEEEKREREKMHIERMKMLERLNR